MTNTTKLTKLREFNDRMADRLEGGSSELPCSSSCWVSPVPAMVALRG